MDTRNDKLERAIDSIIDQIDHLTGNSDKTKELSIVNRKKINDSLKGKAGLNSDIVWQLSVSLSNLVSVKNSLDQNSNSKSTIEDIYDFIVNGNSRKDD